MERSMVCFLLVGKIDSLFSYFVNLVVVEKSLVSPIIHEEHWTPFP
jgi:hypothetical protein